LALPADSFENPIIDLIWHLKKDASPFGLASSSTKTLKSTS
jgi:hypothetical protein